jgi:MoaA/NifB/PqqE/SkfB family radical SAM enzyme
MGLGGYLPFLKRAFVRSGPPVHLTLYVTGRCNARCRHCFHWKEVDAGVEGLPLAAMRTVASTIGGELLWLAFAGGEPFLRDDLHEIAAAFGVCRPRHISIPTNGLVLDRTVGGAERVLRAAPGSYVNVSVSFDGPREIHDRIRATPGGFDKSIETFRALLDLKKRHRHLGAGVICTVTAENQDDAPEFVRWIIRELRPDNVTLNLARGNPRDALLLDVDPAKYRAAVDAKLSALRRGDLSYFQFSGARLAAARDVVMYEQIERQAAGTATYRPCLAARTSAVIFEDGRVAPCEILDATLGNLRDYDYRFSDLWNSAKAGDVRERIWKERCACTWECQAGTNVLFTPSLYPKLLYKAATLA